MVQLTKEGEITSNTQEWAWGSSSPILSSWRGFGSKKWEQDSKKVASMVTKYLQEDGNNTILSVLQNSLENTLGHEDLAYHMWSDEHGQTQYNQIHEEWHEASLRKSVMIIPLLVSWNWGHVIDELCGYEGSICQIKF